MMALQVQYNRMFYGTKMIKPGEAKNASPDKQGLLSCISSSS